ncbi:MAG: GNAT family N-acetyltransferase [Salibacteraceae bacterium]
MILTDSDILLRYPETKDVAKILSWENDVENWLVSDTISPYSEEEIREFVEAGQDFFRDGQKRLMMETSSKKLAGCIDVFDFDQKNRRASIGVLTEPDFRGKGIAKSALKLTEDFCFSQLEIHSLYAEVLETNVPSRTLFEKSGFTMIGIKRDWLWDGFGYHDQVMYQKIVTQ